MNNRKWTSIHFDCGGYYSENGIEWNRKGVDYFSLLMVEPYEDTTYTELVRRVCRKMSVDETKTKVKLSYTHMKENVPGRCFIRDDEDALLYIVGCEKSVFSYLHVEIEEIEMENMLSTFHKEDVASAVHGSNEVLRSDGRDKNGTNWLTNEGDRTLLLDNEAYIEAADNENEAVNHEAVCDDIHIVPIVEGNEAVNHEWSDGIEMDIGQEFESKKSVQDLIERAVHLNCFATVSVKSTTKLYVVKCRDAECPWYLRVAKSKHSDRFTVRTYRKMHTCSRVATTTSSTRRRGGGGSPSLVASVLREDYPGQIDTPPPKTIIGLVQGRYGVSVSYSTARRGKKQAANYVRGTPEESFKRLPSYLHMLKKRNPGTVTYMECDEEDRFKYLFIALGTCIEGFRSMRKVIIVDGTHLKTDCGGVLIFAISQDPDRHHYPIAFGVVDGEKDDSWRWFLTKLKLSVPDNPELVFVSDRNKSIIKTIGEVYPQAKHGYCIYHLSQNVKSHVSGVKKEDVARRFRECAQVYTEAEFITLYDAFKMMYPKAVQYLEDSTTENKWARCYFPGERYNIDTTNCVESINGVFRKARSYSLLPMIDEIVGKIIDWFNKYRKMASDVPSAQKLVPRIHQEMHTLCKESTFLQVQELNCYLLEYNVIGRDGKHFLVDLRKKSCSCRHFDIDRYPCVHAIAAAITYSKTGNELHLHDLCSIYYRMDNWALAYYRTIYPVPSFCDWDVPQDVVDVIVKPPCYSNRKGRKRTTRYPSVGEYRRKGRCLVFQ